MPTTERKLLGTAAQVAAVFDGKIRIEDMYGEAGSALYHSFTLRDNAEIDELLSIAGDRPGPVLELCCGSGRITLPFLRRGYEVVGLDSSPHMLSLLSDRLAEPDNAPYARQLSTVDGDMTEFSLGREFGLVILGATAIWNLDEDGRASLFRSVREHLTEDGRFLATVLTFNGLEGATAPLENVSMFAAENAGGSMLCTFIDYAEPTGLRSTNIVTHTIVDGAIEDTAMYTAWSYLAAPSALAAEVERAGLRVVAQHEVVSKHQITKNNTTAGRRRLLFEISR